jgi:hypothetical protein
MQLYFCFIVLLFAKSYTYSYKHSCKHSCKKSCAQNDKSESCDESTAVYWLLFIVKIHYFLWNFFQKICQNLKKMNFRIRCQIQDPTTRSRVINESRNQQEKSSKIQSLGLPSCSSYFSAYFKHKFFLVNYHEADFVLVFLSPRTCPTVPKSKIQHHFYEEKENVFKTKSRNVKGKIKITTTSEAGHSLSLTSENCNYVVESKVQTPAQVPLEDLSDPSIGCCSTRAKYEGPVTQNRRRNAGKTTTTIKTITSELPDGESSEVSKKLRKTPLSEKMSDKTSGNAVSTKSTITNKKRAQKFKYQSRNNNINNMFYQYKIKYQYKPNYYMTLTLRPMTSESKKESQKDPDTTEISRVQPTSTSRLTSGLALRSTLRLTLYNSIYVILTLQ